MYAIDVVKRVVFVMICALLAYYAVVHLLGL